MDPSTRRHQIKEFFGRNKKLPDEIFIKRFCLPTTGSGGGATVDRRAQPLKDYRCRHFKFTFGFLFSTQDLVTVAAPRVFPPGDTKVYRANQNLTSLGNINLNW
ncbi:hypothetical protein CBL_10696 [Carabus blaptoides fortunei]